MGIVDEATTVYQEDGIEQAGKWMARNIVLPGFQARTHKLTNVLSPLFIKRDDLEQQLQNNGSIQYYGDSRNVKIDIPEGSDHPNIIEERSGTYSISRPFVGELHNVNLVGSYPIPISQKGKVILESIVRPSVFTLNVGYSIRDIPKIKNTTSSANSPKTIDCAVLLHNKWNQGYYHWTAETLTRLEGIERYQEKTGTRPKLIVGPELNRFQRQSLELLGYDQDDLIRWDRWKANVDRFIIPSIRRELNLGETSPVAYWWLRKKMRSAVAEEDCETIDNTSNRIYISREDAPRRQVCNENEVMNTLDKYGFEKYTLSDQTIAENISLFSQADVIVGPHGAGLTDIIYSDDATIIELFRSNDVRPTYYVLANQLGHEYRYLSCDYKGPDLVVDTDNFEEILLKSINST